MNGMEAEKMLRANLLAIYDDGEAAAISDWVMEHITGQKRAGRLADKNKLLDEEQVARYHSIQDRLLKKEPVQYVLNESWFMGLRFYVDNRVLIPRPETEELVEWVISHCKFPLFELSILDVGTGSGCIPVSLKRRLRKAQVLSVDISEAAIAVAGKNADLLGTEVKFLCMDFLDRNTWSSLPAADMLVSNPPYIPLNEKEKLASHVRDFEPSMALFVTDEDPLLFYRELAEFGKIKLNAGGQIFAEMHEDLSVSVETLFLGYGYQVELKEDMQGKTRMIRAYFK